MVEETCQIQSLHTRKVFLMKIGFPDYAGYPLPAYDNAALEDFAFINNGSVSEQQVHIIGF